jgi:SAM-dependent methyltransferase
VKPATSTPGPHGPAFAAQVAAAQVYEDLFVPAEFQEWAARMVAAARIRPGQRVLDVACGTGVFAREAAPGVGPAGVVAGVDIDPGMLAVAARQSSAIAWCRASAESLPYADGSFHAVVSQFGLMFFPDRRRALRELQRVLASGGALAVAVWDSLENTPAYAALVALLEREAGSRAADALRAPFALGDRQELAALFADVGLQGLEIKTHHGTGRFPAIGAMVDAELRGWMPVAGVVLSEEQRDRILREAESVLGPYRQADGSVRFDSPAHIVTGTKP